jgi:hypothetical protein
VKTLQDEAPSVGGGLQRFVADGDEGVAQRLDRERQRIDQRADHQAFEGEGQGADPERMQQGDQRALRAQGDQQVEAQHGRGQDDRQGHQRPDRRLPARPPPGQPPGQGRGQDQQQDRGDPGQLDRQPRDLEHGQRASGLIDRGRFGMGLVRRFRSLGSLGYVVELHNELSRSGHVRHEGLMSIDGDLSASLILRRGGLARVGLERIVLIEAIGSLGSISAAAKQLGLSYKGAWDGVQALNNLFDAPLVTAAPAARRRRGGSRRAAWR